MKGSFKKSLVFYSIILVVLPALAIALTFFFISSITVNELIQRNTASLFDQIDEQFKNHFDAAADVLELNKAELESGSYAIGRPDELQGFFKRLHAVHPNLTNIYYGDKSGRFVMDPPQRPEVAADYDPRIKDWFKDALARGGLTISEPYVFASSQNPGITLSLPVRDADGEVAGVTGVDFEISQLRTILDSIDIFENSGIYIFDDAAHPITSTTNVAPFKNDIAKELRKDITTSADGGKQLKTIVRNGETYLLSLNRLDGILARWVMVVEFPENLLLGNIRKGLFWILVISMFSLVIAIIASLAFSHKLARPIYKLIHVTRKVQEGDLSIRVPIEREKGEIKLLLEEFGVMISALDERHKMRKYISDFTYELLKENREIAVGGEVKDVTVLFTDIRGFTPISENLEPEEVVKLLNKVLEVQVDIIMKYNGILDKFIGDAVMAFFLDEDKEERAIRCALEMGRTVYALTFGTENREIEELGIGAGINTGPVIMGNMGGNKRMDFTIVGDVVNTASRLESHAGKSEVLISKSVAQKIDGTFELEPLGEISLKGKQKKVETFRVVPKEAAS